MPKSSRRPIPSASSRCTSPSRTWWARPWACQARGKLAFASTFAAFFSRAYDQIRMSQYSDANLKFCGSHAGVSIGEDGPSQMGLEDLAMFRAILGSVVLYPCDAVSTERLVEAMARHRGISYLRTTRMATPILYGPEEKFPIGGCKVLRQSPQDVVTVIGAGVTLVEALKAYDELQKEGIAIRVIDLYSVKPVDDQTLKEAAAATRAVITVEDHYPEGGLGDAVRTALAETPTPVYSLAVRLKPKSGKPAGTPGLRRDFPGRHHQEGEGAAAQSSNWRAS